MRSALECGSGAAALESELKAVAVRRPTATALQGAFRTNSVIAASEERRKRIGPLKRGPK